MKSVCIALACAALLSACAVPPQGVAAAPTDAAPACGRQHYPFHALENVIQGDVVLRAQLDPQGRVMSAVVLVPGPSTYIDAAALEGVRSCRFAAAAAPRTLDVLLAYRFRNQSEFPAQGVVTISAR